MGFTFSRFYVNTVFGRFRSVHKISTLDRKISTVSKIGTWAGGPIGFLIRLRQHSAITAFQNLQFYRCRSFDLELFCDFLPLSREIKYFSLFRTFWRFDVVLKKGERKMSQSARFELAQEDLIWFLVRRLNHSGMTAWSSFHFILSVIVELLCGFYFLKVSRKYYFLAASDRFIKKVSLDRKYPQWARLELELDGPIEFLFRLRQHSAMIAFQNR